MRQPGILWAITALLWSCAGLIATLAGNVTVGMLNICISMMFLAFAFARSRRSQAVQKPADVAEPQTLD